MKLEREDKYVTTIPLLNEDSPEDPTYALLETRNTIQSINKLWLNKLNTVWVENGVSQIKAIDYDLTSRLVGLLRQRRDTVQIKQDLTSAHQTTFASNC